MSKGLMGMKFMQRAAAKSSPSTPNGPPSKKARLSNGASAVGTSDHDIIQSGLDAEEAKRQAALDKAAQHAGETKWVLSFKDPLEGKRQDAMKVRQAGFAELDAEDEDEDDEEDIKPIRMQFGGGIKKKADTTVPFVKAENSESESEHSSDDYDSDDPAADLIRQTKREMATEKRESKNKRGDDSVKATPKRQKDNGDLQGLTSISGGRRSGGGGGFGGMANMECYKCGQKGHISANCSSTPRGSAGRGKGKGRR
ncbi:uncharacterized protein J4E87_000225 [Alternaria ethzedia]|uniref:uncharacterized protein n=1 Tax=Alternaria ethzedia TaxID=181014 RepID=UPI0020C2F99B|nr:uncharacterized protein J4E87_000225 [Alternaria ethzedia]KAI4635275.1 hypothetical protein J4E87_000225 [Alternaria ethzedia]KAI4713694.1 hypothetical protein J4E89_001141 [Alternaria sp. Ai002NY15]